MSLRKNILAKKLLIFGQIVVIMSKNNLSGTLKIFIRFHVSCTVHEIPYLQIMQISEFWKSEHPIICVCSRNFPFRNLPTFFPFSRISHSFRGIVNWHFKYQIRRWRARTLDPAMSLQKNIYFIDVSITTDSFGDRRRSAPRLQQQQQLLKLIERGVILNNPKWILA